MELQETGKSWSRNGLATTALACDRQFGGGHVRYAALFGTQGPCTHRCGIKACHPQRQHSLHAAAHGSSDSRPRIKIHRETWKSWQLALGMFMQQLWTMKRNSCATMLQRHSECTFPNTHTSKTHPDRQRCEWPQQLDMFPSQL